MNVFFKFARIPLLLVVAFFAIPKIIQVLFNAHSDVGLIAIVVLVCGIVGIIASKIYDSYNSIKDNHSED